MKLIVKKLQGGECTIEVQPSTSIREVKRKVADQLKIPIEEQKLLSLGRTLIDEHTVKTYPTIKDGSKLNLIVKKPEGISDLAFKSFKKAGMSDTEAKSTTNKFLTALQENLSKLSWDDVERLASDCLEEEPKKASEVEEMIM